jgi:integrase
MEDPLARPRLPVGAHGTINLDQIVPGKWRARTLYRFNDGRRRQVERTGRTKAMAENRLKEALTQIETPTAHGAILKKELSVAGLAAAFLKVKREQQPPMSPNTLRAYDQNTRHIILPKLGALTVKEVKTMRIQTFITEVGNENGAGAASACRTVLSGMFSLAVRNDIIATNPVTGVEGAKRKKPSRAAKAMTPAALEKMLAAVRADPALQEIDFPDVWEFMSQVGCRIGEALALRWSHVNFEEDQVTLGPSVVQEAGTPAYIWEPSKTDDSYRTIVVPKRAMALLKRRLADGLETELGLVFPDVFGKLRTTSRMSSIWAEERERIGYQAFTSHGFRKSVATILDKAGMSPRDIAEYLGHEQPSMTMDVYMDRNTQSKMMAEALDSKFGESSGS